MKLGKTSKHIIEKAMHDVDVQRALLAKLQVTGSTTLNECAMIAQGLRVAAAKIEQVEARIFYATNKPKKK